MLLLKIITCLLPWPLRRRALNSWFGFEIHSTALIGLSWVFPKKLIMQAGARIGHFNIAIHLETIVMGENSIIERSNWITGYPLGKNGVHFSHQPERRPELILGKASAITKNHHIDCTSLVQIGHFSTIAGYQSQLITHAIDIIENRQNSNPIHIGDYTFIGTNTVILGGAVLPSFSILGAKSLLNKPFKTEGMLYGGVPARAIKEVPRSAKYFLRQNGFVN